jgi:4-hydroxy-2-oxovalerate aldolase
MQRAICLTDCTLRDGSYQNDFGFTAEDTLRLSASLDQAGFPEIEVGHGLGLLGATRQARPPGASDQGYIAAAREGVKRAKLGVFAIPGIATAESVVEAARLGIDFLKVGIVADTSPDRGRELVTMAQDHGVEPFIFFMQSSLAPPEVLAQNAKTVSGWGVSTVYVVDSAGFMIPENVADYVTRIREEAGVEVGFHGHNNLHLVMANVIAAITAGATKIDCTLRGLGRSSGNPQTEALALVMQRLGYQTGINLSNTIACAEEHINSKMPGYGNESIDLAVGYAGLHSRFITDVDRIAQECNVTSIDLLLAIGERCEATKLETIAEIARGLNKRN